MLRTLALVVVIGVASTAFSAPASAAGNGASAGSGSVASLVQSILNLQGPPPPMPPPPFARDCDVFSIPALNRVCEAFQADSPASAGST